MMDTGAAAPPGCIPLFLKPTFNPNPNPNPNPSPSPSPNPNPKKKRKLLQELVKSSTAPYQYAVNHADHSPSLNSSLSNHGETTDKHHASMITNHNHSNHHQSHNHNSSNKHNPKRVCRICGRQFSSGRALGGHMRVHGELFNSSKYNTSNTSNHSYVPAHTNPAQIHASHMIDRPQKKISPDGSAKTSPNLKNLKYNYSNSSTTHHYPSHVYKDYKMPPLQAAVRYWPEADKVASNWDNSYFQYLQDNCRSEKDPQINGLLQGHKLEEEFEEEEEEEEEEEREELESVSGSESDSESELEMDNNMNIQTLMLGTDNSEVEDQGAEDLYLAAGFCESKPNRKKLDNGLGLQHNTNYKLRANPKRSKRFSHELDDHESFPVTRENPPIDGNKIYHANDSGGHNLNNIVMEAKKGLGNSLAPKDDRKSVKCSECGKGFWSWKALFGHMRCHPEREWRGILPPIVNASEQASRKKKKKKKKKNASSSLEDGLMINKKKVVNRYSGMNQSSENILEDSGAREGDHGELGAGHWPRGKRSRPRRVGSKEAGLNLQISSDSQEEEEEEVEEEEEEAGVQEQDASETTSVETGQEEDRGLVGRKEGPVINSLLLLAEAAKRVQEEEEGEEFAGPNEDIVNGDLQATTEEEEEDDDDEDEDEDEDEEGDEFLKEHHDEDAEDKMAGLEDKMARYECATCNKSFPSHQALGGHRASHRRMKGCFAKTTSVADSEASTSGEEAPELWLAPAQQDPAPAPIMTHKVTDNTKLGLSPEVMQRPSPCAIQEDHLIMQRPGNNLSQEARLTTQQQQQYTIPLSPLVKHGEKDKSRAMNASPGKGHECTICHRVFSTGQALGGHKRCHWTGVDKSVDTMSSSPPSSTSSSSAKVVPGGGTTTTTTTAQLNYRVSGYTIEHARQCIKGENERAGFLDLNLPAPMDDAVKVEDGAMQASGVGPDGSHMLLGAVCETGSRVLVDSPGQHNIIYRVGVREDLEGRSVNGWNIHETKSSLSDFSPERYNKKKLEETNMWAMQWPMLHEGSSRARFHQTQ